MDSFGFGEKRGVGSLRESEKRDQRGGKEELAGTKIHEGFLTLGMLARTGTYEGRGNGGRGGDEPYRV
jgi:hypothetical protein